MAVMKTHVEKTAVILNGWVSEEIRDLALRHHEKLNGTGYPDGLSASQLTLPQRILACLLYTSSAAVMQRCP